MALPDIDVDTLWRELSSPDREPGEHVRDWLGNVWPVGTFPALPAEGWVGPEVPADGDGFRAGPLEWAAFAIAASMAAADSRPPTLLEMGASQAPWCLSWVRALRAVAPDVDGVRAVAFEAAAGSALTERFWREQGLQLETAPRPEGGLELTGPGWSVSWRQQAVAHGGGVVHFPDVDIAHDNGAQAVRTPSGQDYRGHAQTYRTVTAVDPVAAVEDAGFVHLLHLDIQGGEREILEAGAFDLLSGRVGVLMLGTHSRAAESLAFDLLPGAGFFLVDEEPCAYEVQQGRPALVRDGEQLWLTVPALEHLRSRGLLRDPRDVDAARAQPRTPRPDGAAPAPAEVPASVLATLSGGLRTTAAATARAGARAARKLAGTGSTPG